MAKSLRSKWRRKCRAVKRERYGAKELERLKKTLGIDDSNKQTQADAEMAEITEIATVVNAQTIKDSIAEKQNDKENKEDGVEKMDDGTARVYNKKTLQDQYGNYPVWMNYRKIQRCKKGRAKSKKAKDVNSSKRLTRKAKKKKKGTNKK